MALLPVLLQLLPKARCCAASPILQFCTKLEHVKPVWFCSTSCHLLWFTFTKALWNIGVRNSLLGSTAGLCTV
jgi:hypothetical protein